MSHGVQYHEDGKLKSWFIDSCHKKGLDPYEEIERIIDEGEAELFGHRCWNCGRTWTDGEDDYVDECYDGEGCNDWC